MLTACLLARWACKQQLQDVREGDGKHAGVVRIPSAHTRARRRTNGIPVRILHVWDHSH